MTYDLRPYPEYHDSGLPWLGKLPSHWTVRASKRLFTDSGERAWPDDQQLSATQSHGVIPQAEYERLVGRKVVRIINHLEKRKHVEKDDFVISMRSFQGGLERAWSRGAIRSSYVVLKPKAGIHVPYFAHLFKSQPYIQALRTTSEFIRDGQDLTYSNFCDVPLPVVPLDEQRAIASYLDANAVKVNRFIRNRRRLIEVLNEQKQAIINRAVTRGLNPNAPLKPSGNELLGDIPSHWDARPLRSLGRFMKGTGGTKEDDIAQGIPCIRYGHLYMYFDYLVPTARTFVSETRASDYARTRYGDLLFTASGEDMSMIGKSAVNVIEGEVCCGGDVIILRPRDNHDAQFLGYASDAWHAASQKARLGRGTTIKHIYEDQLKKVWIAIPPKDEQVAIAEFVCKSISDVGSLIAPVEEEIRLIREYRTRLIADVVTGKLDVRSLAPAEAPSDDEQIDEGIDDEAMLGDDEPELVEEAADAND